MGIKFFFTWVQRKSGQNIYALRKGETFPNNAACKRAKVEMKIDNLMLDMNGIFHPSAQKIFEYGSFKKADGILLEEEMQKMSLPERIEKQTLVFEDICRTIEDILRLVRPARRLILCVDGPAPLAKQNQQRQRRFRAAKEAEKSDFTKFDSSAITPGTKFMDFLSQYINWFIRKKISEDPSWRNLEVIFSSEKVPGEGEHKLLNYYRFYGDKSESYCVYANDADLIMLALGTHNEKFFVLRDCMYDDNYEYYILNTPAIAKDLVQEMRFGHETCKFDPDTAVDDFIFISFLIGNDFLPNIPSLEILQKGMEIMFDVYKKVGESYGHLTETVKGKGVLLRPGVLKIFMGTIAQYEEGILLGKYKKKDMFFEDTLLDKNVRVTGGRFSLDLPAYKKDYYAVKLEGADIAEVTRAYIEGMQWVLSYYTRGTPAWRWFYPYHYAPFASEIAEHGGSYDRPRYKLDKPILPFLQLLTVLPPRSAHLLPAPLNRLLYDKNSPLARFCPRNFPIDLSGKKRAWEGLVILPPLEYDEVIRAYSQKIGEVSERDLKRNIVGKSFIYTYSPDFNLFPSRYGNVPACHAKVRAIDL